MIRTDRYRESTLNTNTQAVQYFNTEGGQGVNTVCVSRGRYIRVPVRQIALLHQLECAK